MKLSTMITRVHTSETIHVPQIFLDTYARNEADDQHYIAYCLYSDMDIIGINSIYNNGPGSEQINYGEIFHVMKLMNWSGYDWDSLPLERVYHGAGKKLDLPESGLDFQVMLAHSTSLKLHIDKRVESHLYPENDLGDYLETITPAYQWRSTKPKSIHDVCVPAAIKSNYLGLNWVTRVVPAQVSGQADLGYQR